MNLNYKKINKEKDKYYYIKYSINCFIIYKKDKISIFDSPVSKMSNILETKNQLENLNAGNPYNPLITYKTKLSDLK